MAHGPLSGLRDLVARIGDEATELAESAKAYSPDHAEHKLVSMSESERLLFVIEEMIDTVGWLEASLPQLEFEDLVRLSFGLVEGKRRHRQKCQGRGLREIKMTYHFIEVLLDAVEEVQSEKIELP